MSDKDKDVLQELHNFPQEALDKLGKTENKNPVTHLPPIEEYLSEEYQSNDRLREALADVSHEIWAHWMRYLFSQCEDEIDGTGYVIQFSIAKHWLRQIRTSYADLSEREKDSDRERADKIFAVLKQARHK